MRYYYLKRHRGIFKYHQHSHTKYGYRLKYYDGCHNRHEKSKRGFRTLKDAIDAYYNIKQVESGNKDDLTIASWCKFYVHMIQPPVRKISTYKNYKHLLYENVIPTIGKYKIDQLRLDIYEDKCLNYLLRKGLSRGTVIATNTKLQAVVNYAVKDGYLRINPIRLATVPKANIRPKKVVMNKKQLHKFNLVLKYHSLLCQVIYFTLEKTGMRCGELLALRWDDINLDKRIINIKATRDEYGIRSPKTVNSKRKLILPYSISNLLTNYKIKCIKSFHISDSSLVILGKRGKPLIPNLVPIILKKLLKEAELGELIGRFTPHSFRHQFASNLILSGTSPLLVSKFLGHANPDITMKIYAQLAPNIIPDISKKIR